MKSRQKTRGFIVGRILEDKEIRDKLRLNNIDYMNEICKLIIEDVTRSKKGIPWRSREVIDYYIKFNKAILLKERIEHIDLALKYNNGVHDFIELVLEQKGNRYWIGETFKELFSITDEFLVLIEKHEQSPVYLKIFELIELFKDHIKSSGLLWKFDGNIARNGGTLRGAVYHGFECVFKVRGDLKSFNSFHSYNKRVKVNRVFQKGFNYFLIQDSDKDNKAFESDLVIDICKCLEADYITYLNDGPYLYSIEFPDNKENPPLQVISYFHS